MDSDKLHMPDWEEPTGQSEKDQIYLLDRETTQPCRRCIIHDQMCGQPSSVLFVAASSVDGYSSLNSFRVSKGGANAGAGSFCLDCWERVYKERLKSEFWFPSRRQIEERLKCQS